MYFLVRNIFPPVKVAVRYFSQNPSSIKLHEIVKKVDPESTIKVSSALNLVIRPYDLLDCPDANTLRATIASTCRKSEADLSVEVNGTDVDIVSGNIKGNQQRLECLLEVPVKADLDIHADENVHASNLHGSFIRLFSRKDIFTKNIHSTTISIQSEGGHIKTSGILLANRIEVNTFAKGNIELDKLQGDIFHCKTESGNITTNSCYVDSSNFATEDGTLNLRNVHKKSEIYILKEGTLNMTGINGNIYIKSNGGDMNLQFSEIYGDNIVMSSNSKQLTINVSDLIEETSFIEIHSDQIALEETAEHLAKYLEKDCYFCMGRERDAKNKLLICTKGNLKFGKMSWMDSVKMLMSNKKL